MPEVAASVLSTCPFKSYRDLCWLPPVKGQAQKVLNTHCDIDMLIYSSGPFAFRF